MTYLRLEDGHTFINSSHISKVDHTPASKNVYNPGRDQRPYTRLSVVGLSSSIEVGGVQDIEYFLMRLGTDDAVLDIGEFL